MRISFSSDSEGVKVLEYLAAQECADFSKDVLQG